MAANTIASNQDASSRAAVLNAETARTTALEQQAQTVQAHSLAQYNDFPTAQATDATQLGDYFGSNTPSKPNVETSGLMPQSSDVAVQNDQAAQDAKVNAYSGQQAAALGDLRSFGDLLGTADRAQSLDAQKVGQIGSNERGFAANVLPYQLDAAGHTGDNLQTLGDVLALGGTAAGAYGALKNPSGLAKLFMPGLSSNVTNFLGTVPAASGAAAYPSAY